jgi:O-antigen ligase
MVSGIDMSDSLFLRRINLVMLVGVAATLPTKWTNLNSFFIILSVIVWLIGLIINKKKINFQFKILSIFISFFVLTFISILFSSNLTPLFSKIETRLVIVAFPLILLGSAEVDKSLIKLVLKAFIFSCILISLLCVVHTFYINYLHGNTYQLSNNWLFSSDNLVDRFGFHPNYFSIYCAFSVFIIIFFFKEKEFSGWISFILIVYLIFIQLLLASRVGLMSFIGLFVITIIYEAYAKRKLWLGVIGVILFMTLILVASINSRTVKDKFDALFDRNINQYNEPFRVNRRAIQWSSALEVFLQSPAIGVGTGDMQDELQKVYLERKFMEGYEYQYNPHNLFLDSAASLGVLGLFSTLLLLGISFYSAISHRSVLYLQFLTLFFLISLVESTFSVQKGVAFFFFFNTLFYSYFSKMAKEVRYSG